MIITAKLVGGPFDGMDLTADEARATLEFMEEDSVDDSDFTENEIVWRWSVYAQEEGSGPERVYTFAGERFQTT